MIKTLLIQKVSLAIRRKSMLTLFFCISLVPQFLFADNQIIPGNLGTSDPAPMVDGETLYLYVTADAVGNGDLSIYDIYCYSTKDLYHWKNEGVVLNESNVPWANSPGNLWAPHCAKLGGKYHLYFPENDGSTFRIGHAVSTSPTGPFTADKSYMSGCGTDAIDPNVVLDTGDGGTGKAYLLWNQVGTTPNGAYVAELNSTYDNVTGTVHDIRSGLGTSDRYKEGLWVIKQNNTWYCIIADWTGSVESISYSTSSSLFGPYTKKADILNQNINASTIHAGVVYFLNKWIIVYHTGGDEFGGTINSGTKRVSGIEYISFNTSTSPWTIPAVAKTYRGVGVPSSFDTIQIDRHSPSGISKASISVVGGGEPNGWMVSGISNGGYVRYNDVDFTNSDLSGTIELRVASASAGGSVEVRLDSQTGTLLGTVTVPATGSLTKWQTVTAQINSDGADAITGIKNLVLVFKTTVSNQYTVNWVKIGKEQTATDTKQVCISLADQDNRLHKINDRIFQLTVSNKSQIPAVRIFSINGQEIKNAVVNKTADSSKYFITFSKNISSGAFIVSIVNGESKTNIPLIY